MEKYWKCYQSGISENVDDHLHIYILFQHSNVNALDRGLTR